MKRKEERESNMEEKAEESEKSGEMTTKEDAYRMGKKKEKEKPLTRVFQVSKPGAIKNILGETYHDDATVADKLVDTILSPGLEPGAVDVFLDFVSYSGGPLPEELLPRATCPVLIVWGDKDPWEPIDLGRTLGEMDSVEEFISLENVGHCPHDEAPHLVNPIVERFVAKHAK
eukprot:TRINITY_DN8093_c0_g2_i1.p2 TRINITY_DN8093_c0_g2~~TRINITY_DN8093_c0_g2_i1.p2  ORF type:complete len:173 (-),score=40.83 TRINITY_DN8093_c0_g2_i1:74-592(-)